MESGLPGGSKHVGLRETRAAPRCHGEFAGGPAAGAKTPAMSLFLDDLTELLRGARKSAAWQGGVGSEAESTMKSKESVTADLSSQGRAARGAEIPRRAARTTPNQRLHVTSEIGQAGSRGVRA